MTPKHSQIHRLARACVQIDTAEDVKPDQSNLRCEATQVHTHLLSRTSTSHTLSLDPSLPPPIKMLLPSLSRIWQSCHRPTDTSTYPQSHTHEHIHTHKPLHRPGKAAAQCLNESDPLPSGRHTPLPSSNSGVSECECPKASAFSSLPNREVSA